MRIVKVIHVINSPVVPTDGTWQRKSISVDEARALVRVASDVVSHIGHSSTAELLTQLLGVPVPVRRDRWDGSGTALVFALSVRLHEGQVLSKEEIEALLDEGRVSFCTLARLSE